MSSVVTLEAQVEAVQLFHKIVLIFLFTYCWLFFEGNGRYIAKAYIIINF